MTDDFLRLARPMMRGVKVDIRNEQVGDNVTNRMMRDILNGLPPFTGEIVVGRPIDPDCRGLTELAISEEQLVVPFIFWVYDFRTTANMDLQRRLEIAASMVSACHPCIQYVDHELLSSKEAVDAYAKKVVNDNFFPGIVLREPYGTWGTYDEEIPAEGLGLALQ